MFKFNFKKIQLPAFYFAFFYIGLCVWFFAGPKVNLGFLSPTGFTYGIDFKGGYVHQVTVYSGIKQDEIRKFSEESGLGDEIQRVVIDDKNQIGKESSYLIKSTISKEDQDLLDKNPDLTPGSIYNKKIQELYSKIKKIYGDKYILTGEELKKANQNHPGIITGEILSEKTDTQRVLDNVVKESENIISPSYSQNLRIQAILLVLFVLFLMMIYITFRFKFIYGVGAVASLAHDALIILGYVSIFKVEFDYNIVAAILFILGYSINDTIVIFDRIRENDEKLKDYSYPDVVSISVNQTLARSIITSFTTFMAAMALVIWGGPKIEGFSRAIAVGIFFGTYSSIFVASPVVLIWYKLFHTKNKKGTSIKDVLNEEKQITYKQENSNNEGQETVVVQKNPNNIVNTKIQLSKKQLKKLYGSKK